MVPIYTSHNDIDLRTIAPAEESIFSVNNVNTSGNSTEANFTVQSMGC